MSYMVSFEAVLVAGLPEHGTGHASDHKLLARAHHDLHATSGIEAHIHLSVPYAPLFRMTGNNPCSA